MPCRCPCCGRGKSNKKNFADKLEETARKQREKEADIEKNYRILREDIYDGMMKSFFATGADYRMFSRKYNLEATEVAIKKKYEEPEKEKTGFFHNYLLIHPEKSRILDFWDFIMLLAYLVEMVFLPYTVFILLLDVDYSQFNDRGRIQPNTFQYTLELTIDFLHVISIMFSFTTAIRTDQGWDTLFPAIARNYTTSLKFYCDIIGTFPSLFLLYFGPRYRWAYYFKIVRVFELQPIQDTISRFVHKCKEQKDSKKQALSQLDYFATLLVYLVFAIHYIACIWLYVGETVPGSWIALGMPMNSQLNPITKYITSIYWVVTTLTTVGYGDYKGFTSTEYIVTMIVEFIGILFFSIMMGSINEIFLENSAETDIIDSKIENVDVWLVKLDNSRMSKQLPRVLYDKIKIYIKESLTHDHKKLVEGFQFLEQLKPNLRFKLITQLFKKPFLDDFKHIFVYENMQCGKEFISYFTSQLYCRVFIANQTIVKKGEHFSELYLIFQGSVTLSLIKKDMNEYFRLYSTNYFGDYQIMLGLRASECYKSSVENSTFTFCLKKKDLQDLISTFPDAKHLFLQRAYKRRVEFRRIKKQFEFEHDVLPDPDEDYARVQAQQERFVQRVYSDKTDQQPDFLTNTDYYFVKPDVENISHELLDLISDSEVQSKQTQEELNLKQHKKTNKSLEMMLTQMKAMNDVLEKVNDTIQQNADNTISFLEQINKEDERAKMSEIKNLESCMHELQIQLQKKKAKQQE